MKTVRNTCFIPSLALASLLLAPRVRADVVSDWNTTAADITAAAKLPPPAAYRVMALVQTAVFESVDAITSRYPSMVVELEPAPGASLDAAVAAANRTMLASLVSAQQPAIERAYELALADLPDDQARKDGVALGERAAAAVLALRASDGADAAESYRPATEPGAWVPTVLPVLSQWPSRKPWVLERADQLRPEPPPALDGEIWARDYAEIRALGARNGSSRTPEQTEIARFWEATMPSIYFSVVQSITRLPDREVTQNARLLAAVAQAMDDSLIAIFDAKYHHRFWRPITAIRNGDRDGNGATERDAGWLPFIETPLHPEYPAAHCALAGAVGAVLEAEIGSAPMPMLSGSSPTAPGVTRSWSSIDDFVREVGDARVYDGVHFRNSTLVGARMGREIGALVAKERAVARQ